MSQSQTSHPRHLQVIQDVAVLTPATGWGGAAGFRRWALRGGLTFDAGRNYAVALLLLTLVLPSQVHRHSKEKT